jgi:arylsulfatase
LKKNKNVLMICTDHWSAPLMGCEGHLVIQTPTIDELARNGVRFSNAYTECPVCIPARRTIMTGTTPKSHGDRIFQQKLEMPDFPTLAQTFRNAGYQAYAVGKLHVFPQRNRIGFDDVILNEEGRTQYGVVDDYEQFLADKGHVGQLFNHGMSNNQYVSRPWHLPEELHGTNWTTDQMERTIKRRDPTRPSFWYVSYAHPHPPLTPLRDYLEMYRNLEMDEPVIGEWAENLDDIPFKLKNGKNIEPQLFLNEAIRREAKRAFYALCTHIDHQIRRLIGTLREESLLDDTIILFTADHGDMLGTHNLWAKRSFYDWSARIPMILCGTENETRIKRNTVDARMVGLQDIMPTLLDLCGIEVPITVEGLSMIGSERRDYLYGEEGEGIKATRMIHDGRFKLIYYSVGNHFQLFDMKKDTSECKNLASHKDYKKIKERLVGYLIENLHGTDLEWIEDGKLVGLPDVEYKYSLKSGLYGQRGSHWPLPPAIGEEIKELI